MKVTYGPIVQSASGRFGGVVASQWKGVDLFRGFAPPSNPNTQAQQDIRISFTNLNRLYSISGTYLKAAWDSYAAGRPLIGRNHWLGLNVSAIAGDANLDNLTLVPGDASTIPPASITATPGDDQITVACTAPAIPSGWSLTAAIAAVIPNFNNTALVPVSSMAEAENRDTSSPYSIVFTGLLSATIYQVAAWLEWLAPDGSTRYSTALRTQALTT